jgi:hypothetical protein
MSAAGRRAIIAATKKRWAAIKAAKAAAAAPAPVAATDKAAPAKAPVPVKKGRSHRSGTQGAVHRNEETVGGEKEGGREGESGLSRLTFTRQETQGRAI